MSVKYGQVAKPLWNVARFSNFEQRKTILSPPLFGRESAGNEVEGFTVPEEACKPYVCSV